MKKSINLKTILLTIFCLLSMSCSADKASTQNMEDKQVNNEVSKVQVTPVNSSVENKLATVNLEAIDNTEKSDITNNENLQAENSQSIHLNTMGFEEFFEQFQTTIKNKDISHLEVISDIGSKSNYTIIGLTINFDDIFHADLVERLIMADHLELKDRTLPNGQEGKVFAYDFEDIEDKTINLATFLYFQETKNGWKLVNVDEQSKELCVNEHTVFSCTTKSKKIIKICQSDDVLTYSYGKQDKPELTLKRPLTDVTVSTSKSSGQSSGYNYDYSLTFSNGSTNYIVYSSKESGANGESAGGVIVEQGEKRTDVSCARGVYDDSFNIVKPHM